MQLSQTLRRLNRWSKGKFCALSDKSYFIIRRLEQKFISIPRKKASNGSSIHLLCVNRPEYVEATINCLNSFWQYNPEYAATIWIDSSTLKFVSKMRKKLDFPKRITFKEVPHPEREWQWNKLLIILNTINSNDLFCDADIIWNGSYKPTNNVRFFLREFDLNRRAIYRHILTNYLEIDLENVYMYNVSLVQLRNLPNPEAFKSRAQDLYQIFRNIGIDNFMCVDDIPSIKRMSEQLALSISIQEIFNEIEILKSSDSVMDGGIAESYYLGSSRGYP